jgi:catechol 2,3-dioxygenase-like lactoylglutathione lyase family enzyme
VFLAFASLCTASGAPTAPAHFHHLHLNSTDPAKAIEFYTNTFDCEKAKFAGVMDAVWAQKSWLLFTKAVAGEWYQKHFGATWRNGRAPTREKRFIREFQVGPSSSLTMDNVNIIIFPIEYARQAFPEQWKDRTAFESPKGRVVDHVGFSVENLSESLAKLRKEGVTVTDEIRSAAGGKIKFAFIEGPDKIRIEIVEGQAHKE